MNRDVYNWLENHWRKDNHAKYRHLFSEWVSNITDSQVYYFSKQMYNEINKVLL